MDRRLILLGLAGVGAGAGQALAQGMQSGAGSRMGGDAAPALGAKFGSAEAEHGKKTAIAGAASLESSNVALQKARDPRVKQFATFEHDEQMTIAEVLAGTDPSMGRAKPSGEMEEKIKKLQAMPAGPEFDKAYVAQQIEGHQILLAIQEDYLKVGQNREHVGVTKLARGMIKEHLALLADIQKGMA